MSRGRAKAISGEAFRVRFEYADGKVEHSRAWATIAPAKSARTACRNGYARGWYGDGPSPQMTIERSELVWTEVAE